MKLVILIALILITGQSVNSKKIAECDCICEDTTFYDSKSNLFTDIITLDGGDADRCKTYCKTHHKDTATYFAWVDDTFEDEQGNPAKDFHNSCWCKKETDVDGKERTGVTTGKIDCEPSEYTRCLTHIYMYLILSKKKLFPQAPTSSPLGTIKGTLMIVPL